MTGTRASTSVSVLAAYLVLWSVLLMQNVRAQDAGPNSRGPAGTIHFELPAQPLASALQSYEHLAELSVLIDSSLLEGRTSTPLSGDYLPHDALRQLLEGTGLQAKFTTANAAVIVSSTPSALSPAFEPSETISASAIDGLDDNVSYAILIQARLTAALCRSPQTKPGNYRLVVQLRIGDTGSVTAFKMLDTTGDPGRDAAIARIVRGLVLDSGPPPALQQPVTILLRQLGHGVTPDCPVSEGQE